MDIYQLIRYFRGHTTKKENDAIRDWLSVDDPKRVELYQKAHTIFCGMVMYDDSIGECKEQKKESASIFRKPVFKFVSAAAVLLISVFITATLTRNATVDMFAQNMETITVPFGNPLKLTLNDGTDMWVKGGSTVKYPSVFSRKARNVEVVSGEVCFDVVKDEDKPFIVNTYASDITVLGTRFSVKVDQQDEVFSTSLLRGCVKVKSKLAENDCCVLTPNQCVEMIDNHLKVAQIEDAAIVDWWTTGVLDIAGVPFEKLMRRLELIYDVDIEIRRDKMPEIGYTWGKIRVAGGLDYALSVIAKASDFEWEKDSSTGLIIIR